MSDPTTAPAPPGRQPHQAAAAVADARDRRAACLANSSLLEGLGPAELRAIAQRVAEVSVGPGEVFIHQDAPSDCLYLICSGKVEVFGHFADSGDSVLATLGPGQTIGEMGYFSGATRSASARAVEPTELFRLDYLDLPHCLDASPRLTRSFLRILSGRLHDLNRQFHATAHRTRVSESSLKHLSDYLDVAEHLGLGVGIEALIHRVVTSVSKLLDADRATLFLVDPTTGDLWSKVAQGSESHEIHLRRGHGFAGWVAEHGDVVNVADAYADARFDPENDRRTGYRTHSVLCGPVRSLAGEIVGVMQVINKRPAPAGDTHPPSHPSPPHFDPLDERLFKAFANQAGIAVENYTLYHRLLASHEKMSIMLDVATSVAQTLDLPSLIHRVVEKVIQLLQCDRGSFFVLDRAAGELWSMEAHGSQLRQIRFPVTSGLAGHAARTGEVVHVADAYADDRFNRAFDQATGYRTRTVLCVPTTDRDGNVTGVMQAINKAEGRSFGPEDVALLKAISSQIGVAAENAALYDRTVTMRNYLQSVQESISNSILTLDEDHRVVTANKAALRLLDAAPHECLQRDVREVIGGAGAGGSSSGNYLVRLIDRVYAGSAAASAPDVELPLRHRDRTATVNASVLPLSGPDDERQGLVVVLEDITREKRVKSLLVKKMAKDVAERMLNDPQLQKLGGQRGKATVLFSDIRSFTTISESLTAEQTVELLNAYFTEMVEEVERHQGVLDKFIGDSLMALFGVPFQEPDDAIRAVRTALRMRDRLRRFNAARLARGEPPLRVGIGINTGEVVYGNIGSETRSDYTVIGDPVNLASRVEGLNKVYGSDVVITEATRAELGDHFVVRPIDRVRVKGKTAPTEIFEVLGERGYEPTPEQACFTTGLEAYRRRAFADALAHFRRGCERDVTCALFVQRCETLIASPPAADWDGVWHLTSK